MIGGAGASPPDAPTGVSAGSATATTMSVSFSAPANNGGSAITGFTVTSSPAGGTATGASSPLTVTGLTASTSYTFTVTATNAIGTSPASSPSSAVSTTAAELYAFTSHTFTTAGAGGDGSTVQQGPTLSNCRSAYSTTWDENSSYFTMTYLGYQQWTVPKTATYSFQLAGSAGGWGDGGASGGGSTTDYGGKGRIINFHHAFTQGTVLNIVIGQSASNGFNNSNSRSGGGGGATAIFLNDGTLIAVAGSGGGSSSGAGTAGSAQYAVLNGGAAGASGTGTSPGQGAGGGTFGSASSTITGLTQGQGQINGAAISPFVTSPSTLLGVSYYGWTNAVQYGGYGGFPGGGSAADNGTGGGGAGYGGGQGGGSQNTGFGGGGGCFTIGTAINASDGGTNGSPGSHQRPNGYCIVTQL